MMEVYLPGVGTVPRSQADVARSKERMTTPTPLLPPLSFSRIVDHFTRLFRSYLAAVAAVCICFG